MFTILWLCLYLIFKINDYSVGEKLTFPNKIIEGRKFDGDPIN